MVAFRNIGWLSEMTARKGGRDDNLKNPLSAEPKKSTHLGILAFETAKTMSKLVSLYNSLSDQEICRLRSDVMRSQGVAYLNSMDEGLLLSLACAERLEDLDKAATVVSRLGHKCRDFGLNRFELVYSDLKLGIIDTGKLDYGSKYIEKRVEKMKKLTAATSGLYLALEALTELEVSERKLKQWKDKGAMRLQKTNYDIFYQKLEQQRKEVRYFREISLWSRTFDKCVSLMAHIVCVLYARICAVFGPYIPVLPSVSSRNVGCSHQRENTRVRPEFCMIEPMREQICWHSGPIPTTSEPNLVRFYSQKSVLFVHEDEGFGAAKATKNNRVFHAAGPSTVGGSGLALRYANVILLAEKYLDSAELLDLDSREYLYEMLPENLKVLVKTKLSKNMKDTRKDQLLAEGWKEALKEIMGWLAPIAYNTIQWQLERNPEKMKFESKSTVLLLQTLHFSDKEKTEAAIAEVLVALSCIFRYES